MAQILQLAQLVQHDGVAEVDVGRGRVEAELDPQWHAGCFRARQLGQPLVLGQQFAAAPLARSLKRLADRVA